MKELKLGMMNDIRLEQGDCLEVMKGIESGSVDMVLTDPPYGVLKDVKWDSVIDLDLMWAQIKRIIKPSSIVCFFGDQPYTSKLIMSNLGMYRYSWVWKKNITGFLNSSYRPLKQSEDIIIFSEGKVGSKSHNKIKYNPQGVIEVNSTKRNNPNETWRAGKGILSVNNQLNNGKEYKQKFKNHPTNIINIPPEQTKNIHNTQKPIALMEYLIKTYTNEGETVLDFTMGSGTTMVACKNLCRKGIGIELDEEYFRVASERIKNA